MAILLNNLERNFYKHYWTKLDEGVETLEWSAMVLNE